MIQILRLNILNASCYDFKDDDSGRQVKGAKVTAGAKPENPIENRKGLEVMGMSCEQNVYDAISEIELPHWYECRAELRQSKGVAKLHIIGVKPIYENEPPKPAAAKA
ncbi:hypothetical protein [Magnetofaba australis]|uniref:Uncharacterized protein n=1 Tax=Magnetofaba australis IT-1 TaxID=1434232 RepID=A0A1Y2KB35_9PROT|nr:hypothetical protein [Magnetofaba australis]OSM07025.1 hypothetical protein MAIT1_00070 [Magnetofaba australis IT-1]